MTLKDDLISQCREPIGIQASLLLGLLCSVRVPSRSFDPGHINYVVPKTYQGVVRDCLEAACVAVLGTILPDLERSIRAGERKQIGERLIRG
jgi:hypothetical protein